MGDGPRRSQPVPDPLTTRTGGWQLRRSIACVVLLLLHACTPSTSTPAPVSVIGAWHIEDVDGGGTIDSSRLELSFGVDGSMSGYAGCNRFTGRYTMEDSALDIRVAESTNRACLAEALSLQERRVLATLDAVTTLTVQPDGSLLLAGIAPSRLLLRRHEDPIGVAAVLPVSGEVTWPSPADLPAGAVVRVTAQDVSRVDAAAPELARVEGPAEGGPPYAFTLDIPRDGLAPQARIAVRAQILSGYAILYSSTEAHPVAVDGSTAPIRIRVSPVGEGSGAGGLPVTPSPDTYLCNGETLRIAFEEGVAFLALESGEPVRLERLRAADGEDAEAPRLFTNGHLTLRRETRGAGAPAVSFARGRAAFMSCTRR